MKYCIFREKAMILPVIFPDQINHCDIKIERAELVSAGFCSIDSNSFLWVDMKRKSDSTGKSPRKEDQNILQNAVWNSGTSAFVDYDYIEEQDENNSK